MTVNDICALNRDIILGDKEFTL